MKLKGDYGFLLALAVSLAARFVFAQRAGGGLPSAVHHGLTRFAEEDITDAGVGDVHPIDEDDQQVGQDLVDVLEADDQTTGEMRNPVCETIVRLQERKDRCPCTVDRSHFSHTNHSCILWPHIHRQRICTNYENQFHIDCTATDWRAAFFPPRRSYSNLLSVVLSNPPTIFRTESHPTISCGRHRAGRVAVRQLGRCSGR